MSPLSRFGGLLAQGRWAGWMLAAAGAVAAGWGPDGAAQPSDPAGFATVIDVPGSASPGTDWFEVDSDTQLNVFADAPQYTSFSAGLADGTSTNVEVNIYGAELGESVAYAGSVVNQLGGSIDEAFVLNDGSEYVLFNGGVDRLGVRGGARADLRGGRESFAVDVNAGGVLTLSGGWGAGSLDAEAGSDVTLVGNEFRLNGVAYGGGVITLGQDDVFAGTLADGTPVLYPGSMFTFFEGVKLSRVAVPPPSSEPIVIDADTAEPVIGTRLGETVIVSAGGDLPHGFRLAEGTLEVRGGSVGNGLNIYGSSVTIEDGGSVGFYTTLYEGGSMRLVDGTIGENLRLKAGASLRVEGGMVEGNFRAEAGSTVDVAGGDLVKIDASGADVTVSGGSVDRVVAEAGSRVEVSGGGHGLMWAQTGGEVILRGGRTDFLRVDSGGEATLHGGEFRLNGQLLDVPPATVTLGLEDYLSGTLADGTPFFYASQYAGFNARELGTLALVSEAPPAANPSPAVIDTVVDTPVGVRSGQTVRIAAGGSVVGIVPVIGGRLEIADGGSAGTLRIDGGTLGLEPGASVGDIEVYGDTALVLTGGRITNDLHVRDAGRLEMENVEVVRFVDFGAGSEAVVRGGRLGYVSVEPGASFDAEAVEILSLEVDSADVRLEAVTGLTSLEVIGGSSVVLSQMAFANRIELGGYHGESGTARLEQVVAEQGVYFRTATAATIRDSTILGFISTGRGGSLDLLDIDAPGVSAAGTVVIQGGTFGSGRFHYRRPDSHLPAPATALRIENATFGDGVAWEGYEDAEVIGSRFGDNAWVGDLDPVNSPTEVSRLVIRDSHFGRDFRAYASANLTIDSGSFGPGFDAESGSSVEVRGGSYGFRFETKSGSQVMFVGDHFRLNGKPIADESIFGFSPQWPFTTEQGVFTGVLANGSPIILSHAAGDRFDGQVSVITAQPPSADLTPILVDAGAVAPKGLRPGQSLRLIEGGDLPDAFAVLEADLVVDGGLVGSNLRLVGSTLTVNAGQIGNSPNDPNLSAFSDTDIQVRGGALGSRVDLYDGSTLTLYDGDIGEYLDVYAGARFTFHGGRIGDNADIYPDAEMHWYGGTFLGDFTVHRDGTLHLYGTDFLVDGFAIQDPAPGETISVDTSDGLLEAVLADGNSIILALGEMPRPPGVGASVSAGGHVVLHALQTDLTGDYNANGQVEQGDLDLVLQNWGLDTTANDLPVAWVNFRNDIGIIDQAELDAVLVKWGSLTAPDFRSTNLPEPAAASALALTALLRRRARGCASSPGQEKVSGMLCRNPSQDRRKRIIRLWVSVILPKSATTRAEVHNRL